MNTNEETIFFLRELFRAKKNICQCEIEILHLVVNQLQHQQALNSSETLLADLSLAKAALELN